MQSANQEVRYDMQILADRIEFCWIHLRGVGSLENSLWGFDGQGMRVWLNALSIEAPSDYSLDLRQGVKESVNIPLDFYPLCKAQIPPHATKKTDKPHTAVLMDKGIIIGAEHEASMRTNLPFVIFRHATSVRLLILHLDCKHSNVVTNFSPTYFCTMFFFRI